MFELLFGLFFFAIGLLVWAALGHLMWIAGRAIFSGSFGSTCPRCGGKHPSFENCRPRIQAEDASQSPTAQAKPATVVDDLVAARRLLAFASFRRWLGNDQRTALQSLLDGLAKRIESEPGAAKLNPKVATREPTGGPNATPPKSVSHRVAEKSKAESPLEPVILADVSPAPLAIPAATSSEPPVASPASKLAAAPAATAASTPVHPLEQDYAPSPAAMSATHTVAKTRVAKAPVARRVTADLLRSFMEQSNIRWVELISAALIVVCSVGLVISLWSTLSSTSRFFPSLVFLLATLAVHGAGQYTLRQWKLRTTSRGILHIGLMLIPLSVLVGILLAQRGDGPPQLDISTLAVIAIGGAVYAGLSMTASQALFGRRYLPVALTNFGSSLLLIPAYGFVQQQQLTSPLAGWCMLPLVGLSAYGALAVSRTTVRGVRLPAGKSRVSMAFVIQCLFAIATTIIFPAVLVSKQPSLNLLSTAPWIALTIAGIAAMWISWGWATCFVTRSSVSNHRPVAGGPHTSSVALPSWISIFAWCIASLGSLLLAAMLWQIADNRLWLAMGLVGLATWWFLHGWLHQLRVSLIAGGLASFSAAVLFLEWPWLESASLTAGQWIELHRIAAMSSIGLMFMALAGGGLTRINYRDIGNRRRSWFAPARSTRMVFESLAIAGGIGLFGSAILTVLACLTSAGSTPYGGNWAAMLLCVYGLAGLGVSLFTTTRVSLARPAAWITPVASGLLILGSVRLCQTSPLLADWLSTLRPDRAWAVALALLAPVFAWLAAAVRYRHSTLAHSPAISPASSPADQGVLRRAMTTQLGWLAAASVALGTLSMFAIWTRPDHLLLAGSLGWFLPLAGAGIFLAYRESNIREISVLLLFGWLASGLLAIGFQWDWWTDLHLAGSAASLVLLSTLVAGGRAWYGGFLLEASVTPDAGPPASQVPWWRAGANWSQSCLVVVAWGMLVTSTCLPAFESLRCSLTAVAERNANAFWLGALSTPSTSLLLLATSLLAYASTWIGRRHCQWALVTLAGLWPPLLAAIVAGITPPPQAFPAAMWTLAAAVLLSELLIQKRIASALASFVDRLHGYAVVTRPNAFAKRLSEAAWEKVLANRGDLPVEYGWLAIARGLSLALLFSGATVYFALAWSQHLNPALALDALTAEGGRAASAWLAATSLVVVMAVRWSIHLYRGERAETAWLSGVTLSLLCGCLTSIVGPGGIADLYRCIVGFQVVAGVSAGLAMLTLGYVGLRNLLTLRGLSKGQTSWRELLPRSLKGRRWDAAVDASQPLAVLSFCIAGVLCLATAGVVVGSPIRTLPAMTWLSSPLAITTCVLTLSVCWFLAVRRRFSSFACAAIALTLFAPLVASAYAGRIGTPLGFEAYRALVLAWLVALGIGLVVRVLAQRAGRSLAASGEVAWVMLATVVASLALISTTQDPNSVWPLAELSCLGVLAALSGVASGQAWRGHLAAVAAAAGLATWTTSGAIGGSALEQMWLALWGPLWVALLTQVCQQVPALRSLLTGASERPVKPQTINFGVVRSVSLLLPITTWLASLLWCLRQPFVSTAFASELYWILGLALVGIILSIGRLWEPHRSQRGLAIYLNLIATAGVLAALLSSLLALPTLQVNMLWIGCTLGAMAILAACLRELLRESTRLGPALRIGAIGNDRSSFEHALLWMPTLHAAAALLALLPSVLLVVFLPERALRIAATTLPLLAGLAVLPIAIGGRAVVHRYIGLFCLSSCLVLVGWADLSHMSRGFELDWFYTQRLFVTLAAVGAVHLLVANWYRRSEEWRRPLIHLSWAAFAISLVVGCGMLLGQWSGDWREVAAEASLATRLLSIVTWLALIIRLLQFAIQPSGGDRVSSGDAASLFVRRSAVYGAEIIMGLLTAAIYFHFPDLFSGVMADWWPIALLALAMLSGGVGEWLRRRGETIVSDPVRRSSLLLPVIPLFGVWFTQSTSATWMWNDWSYYSILLLAAAGGYGLQSSLRGSVALRGLALSLLLAAFWSFLHGNPNLRFAAQPLLWLLPPALSALVFVETNSHKLQASVVLATRYIATLVIYLSSSSEVFLRAFDGQLWQPIILLGLALCGVIAGIALRVRAFLFCGTTFTFIALVGMVWHAQQAIGQVWPWWAFGIATGITLIIMLGYFEKNRPQVLAYIDRVKHWQA